MFEGTMQPRGTNFSTGDEIDEWASEAPGRWSASETVAAALISSQSGHMRRSHPQGDALVWLLVITALTCLGAVLFRTAFPSEVSTTELAVLGGSAAALVFGFAFEFRRDALTAARALVGFALSLVVCALVAAALHDGLKPVILVTMATCLALSGVATAWVLVVQKPQRDWPDLLQGRTQSLAPKELEGVQFIIDPRQQLAAPNGAVQLTVTAQNCWSAPRTLVIAPGFADTFSAGREPIVFAPTLEVALPAGSVMQLTVRGWVRSDAVGSHTLRFEAHVTGRGGRRVRNRRYARYTAELPVLLEGLNVFAGVNFSLENRLSVRIEGPPAAEVQKDFGGQLVTVWSPSAHSA